MILRLIIGDSSQLRSFFV